MRDIAGGVIIAAAISYVFYIGLLQVTHKVDKSMGIVLMVVSGATACWIVFF